MRRLCSRKLATGLAVAAVGTFGWATVASAHVEASPAEVPIGDPASVVLLVPNECEGATVGLSVQLPDGAADVAADEVPGWTSSVAVTTPTAIDWTGGSITGADSQQFSISLALTGEVGDVVHFPSVQTCDDGTRISWIEIPETPDASEPEFPAPSVKLVKGSGVLPSVTVPTEGPTTPSVPLVSTTVPAAVTTTTFPAVAPDLSQVDSGLSNGAILIIVTARAIAVAAALVVYARRARSTDGADSDGADPDGADPDERPAPWVDDV